MNNIILQAKGVKVVDRDFLFDITPPENTNTYCAITNKEIIETTVECLERENFIIKSEFHKTDSTNQKFVGGFVLTGGNSETDIMFGYKNSYDKSMSAAYAMGSVIQICSNSCINGDAMLMRKHTGSANTDLLYSISEGVKKLGENFFRIQEDLSRLKEIEITKKTVAQLIGDMYINESIINSHQLSLLKSEVEKESFDYGIQGTAFNLYQGVTHCLKTSHPVKYISSHANLHSFLTKEFS